MNAELLKPSVKDLFDFFKGEQRVKIEFDYQISPNAPDTNYSYVFVGSGDEIKIFGDPELRLAMNKAKAEFKPINRERLEAAKRLQFQAAAILAGTAPIPEL